ncbi:MAG TPA: oxidoreductase [Noviherbaspirillum sp.]|nr:oxidoreductase [Noviherbaspirillum sp.]
MAAPRTVLLAGASGLVGGACLRALLADPEVVRIVLPVRRPLALPAGAEARVEQHVVDFLRLDEYANLFEVDQILCALGTTIKAAGSQQAFREVDYAYPLEIARLGREGGAHHYLVVSAIGANPQSWFFYNRVKGEMERDLLALDYPSTTILRPSLLLGARGEFRFGEEVAKRFTFLTPGPYKPVHADQVAACMVQCARADLPGRRVISSAQIRRGECGT